MAHIHREALIDVPIEKVWAVLADLGALHTRLVPGFVTDCVYDGEVRTVTFGNGLVARERIIDVDPGKQRVAWLADLLPHEAAPAIAAMIEQGLVVMKRHLEATNKAPL